ncbi:MAG TPA: hypothetical protein VGC65_00115 [Bacteroidia bacterium]|jgi:hypothetical protein
MKTLFSLLTILGLSLIAPAQNCKYKIDGVDKTTGKQTTITKSKMIWSVPFKWAVQMSMQEVDSECSVVFVFDYSAGGATKVANKDAELIFVLQDGTEVKLKRGNEKETYPITKEQMDSMLKSKVSTMRYYYTNVKTNEYTNHPFYQATDGEADDIQALIKCVNK